MSAGARLLLEVWRAEGPRAVLARLQDHAAERRRRRRFRAATLGSLPAVEVLHATPSPALPWLGGVPAQLLARLPEQERLGATALLAPHGSGARLEVTAGGERVAVELRERTWPDAVRMATQALRARLLHVEGAAGTSPATLLALAREMPLLLATHDFALVCPRPSLFDEALGHDCGPCVDGATCAERLRLAAHPRAAEAPEWRAQARALVERCAAVVYPSAYLRDAHATLLGEAGDAHVVAPGIASPSPLPSRSPRREPPVVALLGGGAPHKGGRLFAEVVREWRRRGLAPVRWQVFGGGGPAELRSLRAEGVRVHGYHRQGELPARLRRAGVDLALLLSQVPESFSLALSEASAAGVPTLAVAAGALAERVPVTGGIALPARADAAAIVEAIRAWLTGERTAASSATTTAVPLAADAAAAFAALHRDLLARPR